MKRKIILVMFVVLSGLLLSGCGPPKPPEGVLTPDEVLGYRVYNQQIRVYGQINHLGELFCPCFHLSTGGKDLLVW